eukprot:PhF_6_TR5170/c0_g1_i1/m.7405
MNLFASYNFSIRCDFAQTCLFPGNSLQGCLRITCTADTKVRAVRLLVRGYESYHFSKQESSQNADGTTEFRTVDYNGRVHVLDLHLTLAGFLPHQSGEFVMPRGEWAYPFQVTLPVGLPPSYEYTYGSDSASMRYAVTGYVDIPWGKDAEMDFPFQILSCCPLSQWQASVPRDIPQNINVTLCCCIDKGSLTINSRIARTLLVMGYDPAYIRVSIDSKCEEPINAVLLKLMQRNTTNDPRQTDVNVRTVMKHKQVTNIQPKTQAVVDLSFTIPRGILPSFTGVHVRSEYYLMLEFDIPNASDPTVEFPVHIVQAVDNTNFFQPVQFQNAWCPVVTQPQVYAYQPPPTPISGYNYTPMSAALPSGGPAYLPPPPPIGVPHPDAQWAAMKPNQYSVEIQYSAVPPPIGVPSTQPTMGSGGLGAPLLQQS